MYEKFRLQNNRGDPPQKLFYTAEEIAIITSLSRKTVYRMIGEGTFEAIHIGRSVRVLKSSFEAWLSGCLSKE